MVDYRWSDVGRIFQVTRKAIDLISHFWGLGLLRLVLIVVNRPEGICHDDKQSKLVWGWPPERRGQLPNNGQPFDSPCNQFAKVHSQTCLLRPPIYCDNLSIVATYILLQPVYYGHLYIVTTCLLWPPIYCYNLSIVATYIL